MNARWTTIPAPRTSNSSFNLDVLRGTNSVDCPQGIGQEYSFGAQSNNAGSEKYFGQCSFQRVGRSVAQHESEARRKTQLFSLTNPPAHESFPWSTSSQLIPGIDALLSL